MNILCMYLMFIADLHHNNRQTDPLRPWDLLAELGELGLVRLLASVNVSLIKLFPERPVHVQSVQVLLKQPFCKPIRSVLFVNKEGKWLDR